jgi:diguanylate cyclase (GGDEF)-like protein
MNDENGKLAINTRIEDLNSLLMYQAVGNMLLQSQLAKKDRVLIEKRNEISGLRRRLERERTTGLFNRDYFEERVGDVLALSHERRSLDGEGAFAVAMIDFRFFKVINDRFGHHSGDEVLRTFGEIIRGYLRDKKDIGCRWGGDEFVLLLQGVTKDGAKSIVEELKVALEKADFSFNHGLPKEDQVHPTFSYGIAMQTHEKESFHALLQMADRELYESREVRRR